MTNGARAAACIDAVVAAVVGDAWLRAVVHHAEDDLIKRVIKGGIAAGGEVVDELLEFVLVVKAKNCTRGTHS